MKIQDGGPAFPRQAVPYFNSPQDGMSLRDWFAGMALQGLIGGTQPLENYFLGNPLGRELCQWVSESAYNYADATLAAREEAAQ